MSKRLGRLFGLDLVLLHAPSVWDFREEVILQGPLADVISCDARRSGHPHSIQCAWLRHQGRKALSAPDRAVPG